MQGLCISLGWVVGIWSWGFSRPVFKSPCHLNIFKASVYSNFKVGMEQTHPHFNALCLAEKYCSFYLQRLLVSVSTCWENDTSAILSTSGTAVTVVCNMFCTTVMLSMPGLDWAVCFVVVHLWGINDIMGGFHYIGLFLYFSVFWQVSEDDFGRAKFTRPSFYEIRKYVSLNVITEIKHRVTL